ncbi:MAG: hypothetical protein GY861_02205 [bacterium]|jgi:hypothetical protein|nr:hypothetical protein [bacterium]
MSKEKNHAPYTLSNIKRWTTCPGSKKVPRVIYGKGGIGKTSFGDNMIIVDHLLNIVKPTKVKK